MTYASRFDFDDHEQEFVEKIHRYGATTLKRQQIRCLVGLCRRFEDVGYDPLPDRDEPDDDRLS